MHKIVAILFILVLLAVPLTCIDRWEKAAEAQKLEKAQTWDKKYALRPGAIYCISGDPDFKVIFRTWTTVMNNSRKDIAKVTNQQGTYTNAVPEEMKECP